MQLLLRLQQAEVHTESVQRVSQWIATPYPEYNFVRLRQLNLLPLNVAFGDGHMSIHVCVYVCACVCIKTIQGLVRKPALQIHSAKTVY